MDQFVDQKIKKPDNIAHLANLNPCNDPFLAMGKQLDYARHYNQQVEYFLSTKRRYYSNTMRDRLNTERYKPITVEVYNKGRATCGEMVVEFPFSEGAEYAYPENIKTL